MANVQVNLAFTADTSKVKAQLQDLQTSLQNLTSASNKNTQQLGLTKDITQAVSKVRELQSALKAATDVETGKLDLGQFNQQLQNSKTTLKQYASALQSLGPQGQEAFSKLTSSILQAEVPMKRANKVLNDLKTTMMNTMKWQLSSSMLHGFIGAVQSAYGYAQDLNRSLNDIRIVTGYGVDKMAQFAAEANKAAKALSTTTTNYTDASLIYYQQGLDDAEVKERTDVTVKLANVARESAVTISDQMTAVWNNFDDGSKSLEYYADVITKLGAATAASNSEIAEGIEKFSAISHTVGLSYEYATSALTTVVDRTRQSADVVGTAFKTMFARIQGLKLGETLEDGTTLNQYSQALKSVGIDIKDASGELKDMDIILDEMGAKWKELNRDEQVALAQKVAGVRQYQQLVSLMENYDFFKENVDLARGATGALQEQADIYAESWEAARKRVQASAQSIYQALLNDKFFIETNNNFAKFLDGINNVITGLGGLKGVLSLVGGILLRVFGSDLSKMFSSLAYNIKMSTSIGRQEIMSLRQEAVAASKEMVSNMGGSTIKSSAFELQLSAQDELLNKTEAMAAIGKELSAEEKNKLQILMEEISAQQELALAAEKQLMNAKNTANAEARRLAFMAGSEKGAEVTKEINAYKQTVVTFEALSKYAGQYDAVLEKIHNHKEIPTDSYEKARSSFEEILTVLEECGIETDRFKNKLKELDTSHPGDLEELLNAVNQELEEMAVEAMAGPDALKDKLANLLPEGANVDRMINNLDTQFRILGDSAASGSEKMQAMRDITKALKEEFNGLSGVTYTAADGMMALGSQLMSISMLINSIKGLNDIWSDDSTSYWEKLLSTFTSLAMVLPMVINSFTALNMQKIKDGALDAAQIIRKGWLLAFGKREILQEGDKAIAKGIVVGVTKQENAELGKQVVVKKVLMGLDIKRFAIFLALAAIIGTLIIIGKKWYDQQHATEIQAQKATEAADKQREAYNKMKEEQQNLSNTATSYQEVVDKIHNMTAGTIEYTESLVEANEKALELIETFNGLNYTVENGLIKIDKDSLNEALLQQIEYTQNSALAMGLANAYAIEKANAVKEEDVIDQIKDAVVSSVDSVQIAEDILENAQTDNKSFFNGLIGAFSSNSNEGISNTDSAAIGVAIASNAAESEVEKKYDFNQIISLITNELRNGNNQIIANANNLTEFLTSAGIEDVNDGLINALLDNTSELYALGIDINALQASLDATIKSDISNRFKDYKTKKGINGAQSGDAFDIFASRIVSNEMANNPVTDYNTALKIYSEKMGYDFSSATYDSQDKEGTTTFYNALGEKIADIPNQTMLLFSSHENAVDTFSKNDQEDLLKQINEWSKTLTSEKFDALLSFADGRGGDLGSFTANEVQGFSLSDFGITEDNAHFLGYSYEELDQFLTQAQNRILATYSDIEEIGKDKLGKLPVDVAIKIDTYAKKLKNAVNGVGINQDNNYLKAINEALDFYNKLSDKDKTLFLEIDLDLNKSQQNMAAALAILKNQAEAEEIKVGLQMVQQAQGALSTDMSADDYQVIKNNIEWDENSTLSYSDFIQSTYTEQVQYLQDLENQYRDSFINSNQDIIDAAQIRIQQYINMGESYDELINKQKQLTEAGQDTTEVDNKINYLLELQSQIDDSRAEIAVAQRQEMSDYNLNVEEVENYAHYIQEAAGKSKLLSKALKNNEVAAKEVAIAVTRMNRGIDTLAKNQENWISILKKSDKSSAEYAEAMDGMKESLADILNVEKDTISSDFVQKHLKEIQQASKGSEKAIDSLGAALSHDIVANILVNSDLDEDKAKEFLSQWDNLTSQLQDIDVGVTLSGDDELVQKLNQIIKDSGMTAEQANKALRAIGFQTKFKEEPTEIVNKVPVYTTHHTVTITGSKNVNAEGEPEKKAIEYDETSYTIQTGEKKVPAKFTKYAMTTDGSTPQIESLTRTSDGGLNDYSGNNTGGKTTCFIAGTLISLGKIFKNIEDIQIGDIVLSYNEQTHKNEYSEVLQTMIHYVNEEIYDLYIEDEILSVTGIHRFYIKQNNFIQWVAAENLQIGDMVLFADGSWHEIKDIKVSIQLTTVYNFEVANNHNYYVGKNQILAHNKGGGCFEAGTLITKGSSFEKIENIKIGDIVLSYNEQTGKNEYSKVLQTMIHILRDNIYTLYIGHEILKVTGIHKFLINRNGNQKWIPASELQLTDFVLFANGTWHKIQNIEVEEKFVTVYNFEVANNHNYYVGKNQILAHNKGGSKSSTPAEKKDYTRKNDVVSRYKKIEDRLKTVNKNLDKYNTLQDAAFGANKVKMMDNIINSYKEQIKLQEQLIGEAKQYAIIDKHALNAAAKDLGVSALKYDKDGNVSNIENIQTQYYNQLHVMEEKYNGFATKEQQEEYNKSTLEPFTKKKEAFDKALSDYESSIDKANEAAQEKLNLEIELMNKRLEKANYKIRLRIEFRQDEIERFQKELDKLSDRAYVTASRFALLNAEFRAAKDLTAQVEKGAKKTLKTGIYQTRTVEKERYKKDKKGNYVKDKNGNKVKEKYKTKETVTLNDYLKEQGYNSDQIDSVVEGILNGKAPKGYKNLEEFFKKWNISEEAMDTLNEYKDIAQDTLDTFKEMKDVVDSELPNAFAKWQEQVDKHESQMDRLISRYQTWMEIIDTLGGHKLGLDSAEMKRIDQGNINMAMYDLTQALSNRDTAKEMAATARTTFETTQKPKMEAAAEQARVDVVQAQKAENRRALKNTSLRQEKLTRDEAQEFIQALRTERNTLKSNNEELNAQIATLEDKKYTTNKKGKKVLNKDVDTDKIDRMIARRQKTIDQNNAQIKAYNAEIKVQKAMIEEYDKVVEENNKNLEAAREEGKVIKDEMLEGIEEIEAGVEEMEANAEEAENNVLDKFLNVIQTAKQAAENAFEYARLDFEKSVSGGYNSIADMQDAMDKNKKRSERYLADYEKVYELTKLNRDLEKKMDETTNLKAKEKLVAFQTKIVEAQEKGLKMSKYDLEYMQKQYDLEVAKIALEEAQNAKTQVRLTRDAEGNYSYTYTADESKTAETQQNYEDRLNDIIKLSNDYQQQMVESELNAKEEMINALQELHQAYLDGAYTKEEYDKKKAELEAWYTEELMYYADQRDQAARNNTEVLMVEYDKYYGTTNNKIKIERQFTDEQIKDYEKLKATYDSASEKLRLNMEKDLEQYKNGELTTEEYLKKLGGVRDQYNKDVKSASEDMTTFMTELKGAASGIITDANEHFLPDYADVWTSANTTNDSYLDKFYDPKNPNNKNTFVGKINDADETLEKNLKTAFEKMGYTIGENETVWTALGRVISEETAKAKENENGLQAKTEELTKTVQTENAKAATEFEKSATNVVNWYKKTYPKLVKQQKKLDDLTKSINGVTAAALRLNQTEIKPRVDITDASKKIKKLQDQAAALQDAADNLNKGGKNDTDTGGKSDTGGGNTGLTDKQKLTIAKRIAASIWGGKGGGNWDNTEGSGHDRKWKINQVFGNKAYDYIQPLINKWIKSGEINSIVDQYLKYDWSWDKMKQYAGSDKYKFDTGGYTGVWGLDGRWALLHQKELVLNAEDTKNMLAAVKTVREIAAMVDLQAQNASLAGQYALAIGQLTGTRNTQSLDQNVHITAEFPNVQDHNEVELALTSLVNRASQYAWRN